MGLRNGTDTTSATSAHVAAEQTAVLTTTQAVDAFETNYKLFIHEQQLYASECTAIGNENSLLDGVRDQIRTDGPDTIKAQRMIPDIQTRWACFDRRCNALKRRQDENARNEKRLKNARIVFHNELYTMLHQKFNYYDTVMFSQGFIESLPADLTRGPARTPGG